MFRMFVLGAVTLSAWSIALERPNSEAQACRRRRCGGCYSNCGSGYSNYGYASNCNYGNYGYASYGRSRCCHRGYSSCAPQYTTASTCSGYVNQCGYSTPAYNADGSIAPQAQPQTYGAEDVAPPPAPAPNANTTAPQAPATPTPPPAPAPGQP